MSGSDNDSLVLYKKKSKCVISDDSEEEKDADTASSPSQLDVDIPGGLDNESNDAETIETDNLNRPNVFVDDSENIANISSTPIIHKRKPINHDDILKNKDIFDGGSDSEADISNRIDAHVNDGSVSDKDQSINKSRQINHDDILKNKDLFGNGSDSEENERNDDNECGHDHLIDGENPINKVGRWLNGKGAAKKPTNSKPRTVMSKPNKDDSFQIHSETQRLVRESEVTLPYHRPKQFSSFREFKLAVQRKEAPTEEEYMIPEPLLFKESIALPPESSDVLVEDSEVPGCLTNVDAEINAPSYTILSQPSQLEEDHSHPEIINETEKDDIPQQGDIVLSLPQSPREDLVIDLEASVSPRLKNQNGEGIITAKCRRDQLLSTLVSQLPPPKLSGADDGFIELDDMPIVLSKKEKAVKDLMDRFSRHNIKKTTSQPSKTTTEINIVKKVVGEEEGEGHLEVEKVSYTEPVTEEVEGKGRLVWQRHRDRLKESMRQKRLLNYEERVRKYGGEKEVEKQGNKGNDGMSEDDEEWDPESEPTSSEDESEEDASDEEDLPKSSKKKHATVAFADEEAELSDDDEGTGQDERDDTGSSNSDSDSEKMVNKSISGVSVSEEKQNWAKERRNLCIQMAQNGLDQGDLDLFTSEYSLYMNKTNGTMQSYRLEDTLQSKMDETQMKSDYKPGRILSPYKGQPHPPAIRDRYRWELSPRLPPSNSLDSVTTPTKLRHLLSCLRQKYGLEKYIVGGKSSIVLLPSLKTTDEVIKRHFKTQLKENGVMNEIEFAEYEALLTSKEPKIDSSTDFNYMGLDLDGPITFPSLGVSSCHGDDTALESKMTQPWPEGTQPDDFLFSQQGVTQPSLWKTRLSRQDTSSSRLSSSTSTFAPECEVQSQDTVLLSQTQGNPSSRTTSITSMPANMDSQLLPFDVNLPTQDADEQRRNLFGNFDSQTQYNNANRSNLFGNEPSQTQPDYEKQSTSFPTGMESQTQTDHDGRRALFGNDISQDDNDKRRNLFENEMSQTQTDHEVRRDLFGNDMSQTQTDHSTRKELFANETSQTQSDHDTQRLLFGDETSQTKAVCPSKSQLFDPSQSGALLVLNEDSSTFPLPPQNDSEMEDVDEVCIVKHKKRAVINDDDDSDVDSVTKKAVNRKNLDTNIDLDAAESDIDGHGSDIDDHDSDIDDHDSDDGGDENEAEGDDESEDEEGFEREKAAEDYGEPDEEEMLRQQVMGIKPKKLILKDFVESEAELSGSELGSADEDDGEHLDAYEEEEGDQEALPSMGALRRQVEKVHNRLQIDQDHKEIKYLQEMYLEDGELHTDTAKRQRRFKWLGIDNVDNMEGADIDDDDEVAADGDETELDQRPQFSSGNGPVNGAITDSGESDTEDAGKTESQLLNIGKIALLKKSSTSILSNTKPAHAHVLSENMRPSITSLFPPSTTTLSSQPTLGLTKRGSFLSLTGGDVSRLQSMVRVSDSASLRSRAGMVCFSVQSDSASMDDTPHSATDKPTWKRQSSETPNSGSKLKRARLSAEPKRVPLKSSNSIFHTLG